MATPMRLDELAAQIAAEGKAIVDRFLESPEGREFLKLDAAHHALTGRSVAALHAAEEPASPPSVPTPSLRHVGNPPPRTQPTPQRRPRGTGGDTLVERIAKVIYANPSRTWLYPDIQAALADAGTPDVKLTTIQTSCSQLHRGDRIDRVAIGAYQAKRPEVPRP